MLKILSIIDTAGPGGAESIFLETSTRLDPDRFRVVSAVGREGWLADLLRQRGQSPFVVSSSGSLNVGYLSSLVAIARRASVDVIVGHLYGSSVYGTLAGRILGIPSVCVFHGQSDVSGPGRFQSAKRLVIRNFATRVVFVSDPLKSTLQRSLRVPEARCAVIPNGVDPSKFLPSAGASLRKQLGISEATLLVGAVGNVRGPKSYNILLRAARRVLDSVPDVHFLIAGEGRGQLLEELLQLRKDLGLVGNVSFLGYRNDIPAVLSSLNAYVLSSTTEGFSIACLEAMAAGVPVVSTRCGGPEDLIRHGVSGILVPILDSDALAEALLDVLQDKKFARALATAASQNIRDRYTLESMISSYEELFEAIPESS